MRTALILLVGVVLLSFATGAQTVNLGKEFRDDSLGYVVSYPSDWIYQRPEPFTVVFSGQPGTAAYHTTVTIQNIASTKIGGIFEDVISVVNDYKCQLVSGLEEIYFYDQKPWIWTLDDGRELHGIGFTAEYPLQGDVFKTSEVIFPHANGNIFCSWAYSAPKEDYDNYIDIVNAMFDSWTFTKGVSGSSSSQLPAGTTSPSLAILFEARDHIYRLTNSDSEFNLGKRDKKQYTITVLAPGYLACILIDEPEQWIGVKVYNSAGEEVAGKATTAASIYGGTFEVLSGTYMVEVGPGKFLDDSDFQLYVVFSRGEFTEEDLIPQFGDPYQVLGK